jgi:hypothetical protein
VPEMIVRSIHQNDDPSRRALASRHDRIRLVLQEPTETAAVNRIVSNGEPQAIVFRLCALTLRATPSGHGTGSPGTSSSLRHAITNTSATNIIGGVCPTATANVGPNRARVRAKQRLEPPGPVHHPLSVQQPSKNERSRSNPWHRFGLLATATLRPGRAFASRRVCVASPLTALLSAARTIAVAAPPAGFASSGGQRQSDAGEQRPAANPTRKAGVLRRSAICQRGCRRIFRAA